MKYKIGHRFTWIESRKVNDSLHNQLGEVIECFGNDIYRGKVLTGPSKDDWFYTDPSSWKTNITNRNNANK